MAVEQWSMIGGGVLLVMLGFAGMLLPALPGAPVMLAGFVLLAWAEDFLFVGSWTLVILAVMAAFTYVIDFGAALLGAQRFGASPRALLGAGIGAVVGLFFGLPGIFLGPLLGACIGQLTAVGDLRAAAKAGFGTFVGLLLGASLKIAIAVSMLALFLFARFL